MKGLGTKLTEKLIIIVLVSVAFVLWLVSIPEAKLNLAQGLGELGLFSILPFTFFISLSLLSLSFLITLKFCNKNAVALFCQIILFIVFINLTPMLIEGTPRLTWSYVNYRAVDYIFQTGQFNPLLQWIHNWPGFSILYSVFIQITVIPEQIFVGIYPTFFNIMLLLPLFLLFRLVFDNKVQMWITIWIFYVFNWIGQDYFSMQSVAFLTFILILFGFFKHIKSQTAINRQWFVTNFILFSFVTFSHMLTSIIIIAIFFAFFLTKYFRKNAFMLLLTSIFMSWAAYGAITYLQEKGSVLMSKVFNLEFIFQSSITSRVAGSTEHQIVAQTRVIFSASLVIFALVGLILTWRKEGIMGNNKKILVTLFGIFLLLGFVPYGGEILMRAFMFSLIPLSYFIAKGLDRKVFFCIFAVFLVVIAPSMHVIAHYGNEVMNYVPNSEVQGTEFINQVTAEGYIIGPSIRWSERTRDFRYRRSYEYFAFTNTEWINNKLTINWVENVNLDWPKFIGVSYGIQEFYEFYLGDPTFMLELDKNISSSIFYNRIYSNPCFDLYVDTESQ